MTELPLVVGAVVVDDYPNPSRVLAARRTHPPELAGQWEFPGGKVEPGESPEQALIRELFEELAIDVQVVNELHDLLSDTWPASNGYQMRLFYVTIRAGEPIPIDGHDALVWLNYESIGDVRWLESDLRAVDRVRDTLRHTDAS